MTESVDDEVRWLNWWVTATPATAVAAWVRRVLSALASAGKRIAEVEVERDRFSALVNQQSEELARLRVGLEAAEAVNYIAGQATPWPIQDVVLALGDATGHFLRDHDCDHHGYEKWAEAFRILQEQAWEGPRGRARLERVSARIQAAIADRERSVDKPPIPMVLHCPSCHLQHVDAPEPEKGWTNPPHKSHQCHHCGAIWRPADVATNGVERTKTQGSDDSWRWASA